MRSTVLLISLLAIISLSFHPLAHAQEEFNFLRAFSDYIYTYDQYRLTHKQYQLKLNEYQKFQTLTAQTEAFQAGLSMLLKRDDVVRTHLTALRLKLKENPGVLPLDREELFSRIDQEVNWLFAHQTRLSNTTNLSELVRISKELETRYSTINILMYQALTHILAGKQNTLRQQTTTLFQALSDKVSQMKSAGESTQILERWLVQAQERIQLSLERQTSALAASTKISSQNRNLAQEFLDVQFALKESHQYLKEATSSLQEIIRDI